MELRQDVMPGHEIERRPDASATPMVAPDGPGRDRPEGSGPSLWVVVLAGGQGTRLQQFTRQILGSDRPKQFCHRDAVHAPPHLGPCRTAGSR
jgi:hypothetical protein